MSFAAKKSLGQHFLLNPSTIEKILEKAHISANDRVLEIGPGPGVMTEMLARRALKVVAVEKDRRFATLLQEKLRAHKNVIVIEADFLNSDIEEIVSEYRTDRALPVRTDGANDALNGFQMRGSGGERLSPPDLKWKVVANLPYNIATEALFHLLELSSLFISFHLMVQKEVAERLVAKPGTKDYGILSVFAQLFSENRIVMRLPPGAFTPPPKVDSAVVEFRIADGCRFDIHHLPTFESVVRSAFGQRRKTITNALKSGLKQTTEEIVGALNRSKIPPTARAETVPIDRFASLANNLYMESSF